ncbi:hypothetical protein ACSSS7_006126 [Eimeria intestinalis]
MGRLGAWGAVVPVASVIPGAFASKASPIDWDPTEFALSHAFSTSGVFRPRILPPRRGPLPGALLTSVVLVLSCVAVAFVVSTCVRKLQASSGTVAGGVLARSLAVGGTDSVCGDEEGNEPWEAIAAAEKQLSMLQLSQSDASWLKSGEAIRIARAKDRLERKLKALKDDLEKIKELREQEALMPAGPVRQATRKFRSEVESRAESSVKELKSMGYISSQDGGNLIQMAIYWSLDRKVSFEAAAAVISSTRVRHPDDPFPGMPNREQEGALKRLVGSYTGKMNTCAASLRSGATSAEVISSAKTFLREAKMIVCALRALKNDSAAKTVETMQKILAADLAVATGQAASPPSSPSTLLSTFSSLRLSGGPPAQPGQPPQGASAAPPAPPAEAAPAGPAAEVQPQAPSEPSAPPAPPPQQHPESPLSPGDQPGQPAEPPPTHPGGEAQPGAGAALAPGGEAQPGAGAALAPGIQPQAPGPADPRPPLPLHPSVGPVPPHVGRPGAEPSGLPGGPLSRAPRAPSVALHPGASRGPRVQHPRAPSPSPSLQLPPSARSIFTAPYHSLPRSHGPLPPRSQSFSVLPGETAHLPSSASRSSSLRAPPLVPPAHPPTGPPHPRRDPGARPRQPAAHPSPAPSPLSPPSVSRGRSHAPGPPGARESRGLFASLTRGFSLRRNRKDKEQEAHYRVELDGWTRRALVVVESRPSSDQGAANAEYMALQGVNLYEKVQGRFADERAGDRGTRELLAALQACGSAIEELRILLAPRWGAQLSESLSILEEARGAFGQAQQKTAPRSAPVPESSLLQSFLPLSDAIREALNLLTRLEPLLSTPSPLSLLTEPFARLQRTVQAAERDLQQTGREIAAAWSTLLTTAPHATRGGRGGGHPATLQQLGSLVVQARLVLQGLWGGGIVGREVENLEELVGEKEKAIPLK